MSGFPNVIAFAVGLVDGRKAGTGLAAVPIFGRRAEPGTDADPLRPPFVVLKMAGAVRDDVLPVLKPARVSATVFGRTERESDELYRVLSDLIHRAGPYVTDAAGLWKAYDETGPQPSTDPETSWPTTFGVFDFYMTDRSI